jgi:hypothetical protein
MKRDVQRKANSVLSDAVALMIRPLISSDVYTGRAVKTKKRGMEIAYRFLISGLRLDTTQPNLP